jgi:hypothetical protein
MGCLCWCFHLESSRICSFLERAGYLIAGSYRMHLLIVFLNCRGYSEKLHTNCLPRSWSLASDKVQPVEPSSHELRVLPCNCASTEDRNFSSNCPRNHDRGPRAFGNKRDKDMRLKRIHSRHQNTEYTTREYSQCRLEARKSQTLMLNRNSRIAEENAERNNNDIAQAVPQSYVHPSYRIKSMSHHQSESHHILR